MVAAYWMLSPYLQLYYSWPHFPYITLFLNCFCVLHFSSASGKEGMHLHFSGLDVVHYQHKRNFFHENSFRTVPFHITFKIYHSSLAKINVCPLTQKLIWLLDNQYNQQSSSFGIRMLLLAKPSFPIWIGTARDWELLIPSFVLQ